MLMDTHCFTIRGDQGHLLRGQSILRARLPSSSASAVPSLFSASSFAMSVRWPSSVSSVDSAATCRKEANHSTLNHSTLYISRSNNVS